MSSSFKNIGVVASATMGSRVLGLGRDMLVTAVFGTASIASAFYAAFTLPNLFRRLLGEGALTAALVPTLAEELKHRERAGAFMLVNQVASWLLLVSAGVALLGMTLFLQAGWLAAHAQRWNANPAVVKRWLEAADLTVILFPYLAFVALAAAFSAALQTLRRFLAPALSPIWLNVSIIVLLGGAAYAGWSGTLEGKMLWLCAGALLGGVLQLVVPAFALAREGWRPRFTLGSSEPLRQVVRLMGPTVFGSAIYLINMVVLRFIGLSIDDSAVVVLNLATRLVELPIGVFTAAVATVVFPLIAQHAAAGDWTSLAASYRKGMRLILVVNVPAAAGLMVLSLPIIRLLFERGEFRAADTLLMQPVLVVFAAGLPIVSFVSMVLRAFYAQKDTATPVRAALLSFLVNLGLSLALMRPLGTVGLAVASNVALVVQAVYLQRQLVRRRGELSFRPVWPDLVKVIGATAVMAVLVGAGWWAWSTRVGASAGSDAAALLLLIATGAASYAALLWAAKIEGRDDLFAILQRAKARFAR